MDLADILYGPTLADMLLIEDGGANAIDWSFADRVGLSILRLADELRRRPMSRDQARLWLKIEDLAGGIWFETVWAQALRISGQVPSKGGRPPGSRNRALKGHVRVSAALSPLAVRHE